MTNVKLTPIAVLGAGSWGTALACHLANNGQEVYLWGRDGKQMAAMQRERRNQQYLPDVVLPPNLHVETDLAKALAQTQDLLVVVPSRAFRETLTAIKSFKPQRLIWATKGLDPTTHQLLHVVSKEILGDIPLAVLAGPSFAKEVAKGLPTAVTIASKHQGFASDLSQRFHSKTFRVYTSSDIIGVEIGSATKNVLAIAVGIADGLGFGANTRSALITRGLAEMIRLGLALGAQKETFIGLSGLGDLILTCTDNQSRNRRLGLALGAGKSSAEAEKEIGQVVEGIGTAAEIYHLAAKKHVEMPICQQVYEVLRQGVAPMTAVERLLSRAAKTE